jgi:CheY-like chemotaxis protein
VKLSQKDNAENISIKFHKSNKKFKNDIKLLYVEDVASNRFLMQAYCNQWGFQLDTANDGIEALKFVGRREYDLILLDIQMPDLDGFQVAQRLEQLNIPLPPIIALSADISDKTRSKIEESNISDFLRKPLHPDILLEKVLKYTLKEIKAELSPVFSDDISIADLLKIYKEPNDLLDYLRASKIELNETINGVVKSHNEDNLKLFSTNIHKLIGPVGVFSDQKLVKLISRMNSQIETKGIICSKEELKLIIVEFELLMKALDQLITKTETKILENAKQSNPKGMHSSILKE